VSYDLAVWEGERPAGDAAAGREFERLWAHYVGGGQPRPPTPRIAAYVQALLDRYPDIDTGAGEDSHGPMALLSGMHRVPLSTTAAGNVCHSAKKLRGLRHGLVIACFGLTVNVALRVAESPVMTSPAQPRTL